MLRQPTAIICLSNQMGGMELDALKLSVVLHNAVPLLTIIKKDSMLEIRAKENSDYDALSIESVAFSVNMFSPNLIFSIRKKLKQHAIKNVIFFGASEMKSLYFTFLFLGINLIIRHGTSKSTPKKDWFHRLIYSDVSYHVSISKHLLNNVKKIVPFAPHTKDKLIIPSMYKSISTQAYVASSTLRILHVGRVVPGKGIYQAVKACQILEENSVVYTFDSYGPSNEKYQPKLEALIQTLSYKEKIHFNGFTDNVFALYKTHDIFIFPSAGEGYGNVMMEAISHGIICLSYDNTAISDFKAMGFHIHLVKDGSQEALNEKLLYLAQNLTQEIQLSQKNIQKAEHIFSKEREAKDFMEILI